MPGPDVSLSIIGSKEPPIHKTIGKGTMTTYVMENGAHYKTKIKNNGHVAIQGDLFIDGKKMGRWIYGPGKNYGAIERPLKVAKKFTFYTVRAVRAAESAVAAAAAKVQAAKPATAGEEAVANPKP